MKLEDYMKPLKGHKSTLPPQLMRAVRDMAPDSLPKFKAAVQQNYENLIRTIESMMNDPERYSDHIEKAAEACSHLILDAAFLHDGLGRAMVYTETFPYNHLADKLMPNVAYKQKGETDAIPTLN